MSDKEISLKGLDDLGRNFLASGQPGTEEFIVVQGGQKASDAAVNAWYEERKIDFVRRSCTFTEDLIAFVMEQRRMRELSDEETIFGIALATINLRAAYGSPQGEEKKLTKEQVEALLERFDTLCYHAQQYWDANK